jgi:hypothetical protein
VYVWRIWRGLQGGASSWQAAAPLDEEEIAAKAAAARAVRATPLPLCRSQCRRQFPAQLSGYSVLYSAFRAFRSRKSHGLRFGGGVLLVAQDPMYWGSVVRFDPSDAGLSELPSVGKAVLSAEPTVSDAKEYALPRVPPATTRLAAWREIMRPGTTQQ